MTASRTICCPPPGRPRLASGRDLPAALRRLSLEPSSLRPVATPLACHLAEFAVRAEPGSREAHAARADLYRARAGEQESSMARNILNHAALASDQLRRDLAGRE